MFVNLRRIGVIILVCGLIAVSVYSTFSVVVDKQNQATSVSKAVCEAQNKQSETLVNLLGFFQGRSLDSKTLTESQKQNIIAFYSAAIKQLPTQTPCN